MHIDPRLIAAGVCLGTYVLSYVAISPFGAYVPVSWGMSGSKSYHWAAPGFYDPAKDKWIHGPLQILYAPLTIVDHHIWHNHSFPEPGDPQHTVATPAPRKARLVSGEEL